MRETLSSVWAWTKIVAFGLVLLYVALLLFMNRNAKIEPDLSLVFVTYRSPPAVPALLLAGFISAGGVVLAFGFYRALRRLKQIRTNRELHQAQAELHDIKAKAARRSDVSPAGSSPAAPHAPGPDRSGMPPPPSS